MPQSQRDVRNRIGAVKNIQKITRAMAMVATARLRRAEQRIEALRPYASAIRRMTRQAAEAAGPVPRVPIFQEHAEVRTVGLLLVAGDRGLAGAFNSNIIRAGVAAGRQHEAAGRRVVYFASGRRIASSLDLPGVGAGGQLHRLHRPARLHRRPTDRGPAGGRISRRRGRPGGGVLQRVRLADLAGGAAGGPVALAAGHRARGGEEHGGGGRIWRGAAPGRAGVRARPRDRAPEARSRLRRDLDLPGPARVDRVRARRPDDRHAPGFRQRRRTDPET